IFSSAALAIAFAIAWMLSGHMVRPLRQLRNDASALAAGQLSHRTTIRSGDELGVLANAFNSMAESLEQRQEEADAAADDLRKAKDTLAAVIDAAPTAIVSSDHDRNIVLWSRGAEQMFGYRAEEMLGHPTKLVPPEGRAESKLLFDRACAGETLRGVL